MVAFDERVIIGLVVVILAYLSYRFLTSKQEKNFEKEIEEIVKSEAYKVKGRFDE